MVIETGKVELALGAIAPVERGLWHAAGEKLQEASVGILHMEQAKDRIEFENGWTRVADSLEQFWTRFKDEGNSTFSSFQPWAGKFEKERKSDALLTYLFQARHQSQHGRIALEWSDGKIQIGGGNFCGSIRDLRIFADGTFQADINLIVGSDSKFQMIHVPGEAILPLIENKKHKQFFPPPGIHRGRTLTDTSPLAISRLGFAFYEEALREAIDQFGDAPQSRVS